MACPEQIKALAGETGVSMEYETALFNTDEVMQVNILMDSDDWDEMLENAMEEEYYSCNVEVNGKTFLQCRNPGRKEIPAFLPLPTIPRRTATASSWNLTIMWKVRPAMASIS